jgi:hypothetical protein
MCHHHRYRHRHEAYREPTWSTWSAPPARAPEPPAPAGPIRAGDADRERVVEALRMHAGAGRLDAAELERRIEAAYAATYVSDLDAVLAELPPLSRAGGSSRSPRRTAASGGSSRALALLAAIAALIVVTTLTGLYALWWLMWPIAVALHPHRSHRRRRPAEAGPRPIAS